MSQTRRGPARDGKQMGLQVCIEGGLNVWHKAMKETFTHLASSYISYYKFSQVNVLWKDFFSIKSHKQRNWRAVKEWTKPQTQIICDHNNERIILNLQIQHRVHNF